MFAHVQTSTGELKVQWGSRNQMQCRVKYQSHCRSYPTSGTLIITQIPSQISQCSRH
ncbi:hypothetical protein [Xenorhabdus littoralis]|uniref:hypothetical protein n=1 Tax=Xenorhabdus littoralis TaxID=2582835 RepID=UPI0034DE0638